MSAIFNLRPQHCPSWGQAAGKKRAWGVDEGVCIKQGTPRVVQGTPSPLAGTQARDSINLQGRPGNICQLSRKRKWAFLNTFNGQSELQLMSLLRRAASFLEPCLQGSGGILDGKALLNSCALESLTVMWPPPSFPFKPAFGFQVQTRGRKNKVGHVLPWKSSTANARFQREVGDADLTFS